MQMTSQMQTLSVRVPSEDIEWLASLEIPGAVTPSDKLRGLIAQMRRQHQGTMDYAACVAWLRDLLAPFVVAIREAEHRQKLHSDAINAVIEWVPQIAATLLAERRFGDGAEKITALEDSLVQRCFQLTTTLLRLGITPRAECYDPSAIERHLGRVIELADLISADRKQRKGN
jgi:hypothetical protein